jgi:surface polysaccharide O-acyltransferase-like enzyme
MNISVMIELSGLSKDIPVSFGTIFVAVIFVKGIERTPQNRYLFR